MVSIFKRLKYEENYKYVLSEIEDGVLRQEIKNFIKSYITYTDRNKLEVAIEVCILNKNSNGEQLYNITYLMDYYDDISLYDGVQQIELFCLKITL